MQYDDMLTRSFNAGRGREGERGRGGVKEGNDN